MGTGSGSEAHLKADLRALEEDLREQKEQAKEAGRVMQCFLLLNSGYPWSSADELPMIEEECAGVIFEAMIGLGTRGDPDWILE